MKRPQAPTWGTPALLAACLAAAPLAAMAQDTTPTTTAAALTVKLLEIGDRDYNGSAMQHVNAEDCADDNLKLTFRVDGLGVNNPEFIEVWMGNNCEQSTRNESTSSDKCTRLTSLSITSTQQSVPDFEVPVSQLCDSPGKPDLYFLGVQTELSSEDPSHLGMITVQVDKDPPAAPTKVDGGSGETEIKITWNSPSGEVEKYLLVWDANASSRASSKDAGASDEDGGTLLPGPKECSSNLLFGGSDLGGDADELPSGLKGKSVDGNVESTTIDGTNIGTDLAAVAVIAIDKAGNASRVSNVSCIHVVPTTGFWDQYQADGGNVDEGCACSAPGHTSSGGAAWPIALAFGALLLRSRKRSS